MLFEAPPLLKLATVPAAEHHVTARSTQTSNPRTRDGTRHVLLRSLNRTVPQKASSSSSIGDSGVCSGLCQLIPNPIQNQRERHKALAACWAPAGIATRRYKERPHQKGIATAVRLALERQIFSSNHINHTFQPPGHQLLPYSSQAQLWFVLLFHQLVHIPDHSSLPSRFLKRSVLALSGEVCPGM